MDKKKTAFIIAGIAIVLFVAMLVMQMGVFGPESEPVEPGPDFNPPTESKNTVVPELTEGDAVSDIETDLEGIDLEGIDVEFQDIEADLENL
jgi:hypothetical protein